MERKYECNTKLKRTCLLCILIKLIFKLQKVFIMSKLLFKSLGIACAIIGFASCENDLPELVDSNSTLMTKSVEQSDTVYQDCKFIFDGQTYEYVSTVVNDSVVSIDDPTVVELLSDFEQCPELVSYIHKDGTVEFFTDRDTYHAALPGIFQQEKTLVTSYVQPYAVDVPWNLEPPFDYSNGKITNLYLCDDICYKDTYHMFYLTSSQPKIEVPELKSYGLNDKVSSLFIYTYQGATLVELYEDSDYKDNCLSIIVYENSEYVVEGNKKNARLETIPLPMGIFKIPDLSTLYVLGHKKDSWNDRFSSLKMSRL